MQYRYISDLHLYDVDSVDWRPEFANLDVYAWHLLTNWNAVTDPDDIVIVNGDIGLCCKRTFDILNQLNGTKILVLGNHDIIWGQFIYSCGAFSGVHGAINSNGIYIQHIPEKLDRDYTYFIHGHHHRYDMNGMLPALQQYARDTCRLNCAADLNNHRPCTLQELITNKEILLDKYKDMGLLQEVN